MTSAGVESIYRTCLFGWGNNRRCWKRSQCERRDCVCEVEGADAKRKYGKRQELARRHWRSVFGSGEGGSKKSDQDPQIVGESIQA
jgi:hypothetical protein